ncbi:MAG: allophanate hydrolase subunit 1 [Balneolaceae bacterium]|nr:allophanate hydrolase subunit 1 [Balneolaceae bacterium]
MAVTSLRINHQSWLVSMLNEHAIILQPEENEHALEHIHKVFKVMGATSLNGVIDLVPAYDSLTIFWDASKTNKQNLIEQISSLTFSTEKVTAKTIQLNVEYSKGLDWVRVEEKTGLNRSEIIKKHSATKYKVAMIGFLPGFIFLDGLAPELAVPRLDSPRNRVPKGAIAIGGSQTGMYSLPSAGGWNIIGISEDRFFNADQHPPITIMPGDFVQFVEVG